MKKRCLQLLKYACKAGEEDRRWRLAPPRSGEGEEGSCQNGQSILAPGTVCCLHLGRSLGRGRVPSRLWEHEARTSILWMLEELETPVTPRGMAGHLSRQMRLAQTSITQARLLPKVRRGEVIAKNGGGRLAQKVYEFDKASTDREIESLQVHSCF